MPFQLIQENARIELKRLKYANIYELHCDFDTVTLLTQ